jgi:heme-degrading monooxygenase HmoA
MYARTITAHLVPGSTEQATRTFREKVVPEASNQPGFVSASLFVDRDRLMAQATTIWESRDARRATSEGTSYQDRVMGLMQPYLVDRTIANWEVVELDLAAGQAVDVRAGQSQPI